MQIFSNPHVTLRQNKERYMTERKKDYIHSLTGLKVICMLLIFWWHSTMPKPQTDLGARCCEFLFVVSGFLVGYKYYGVEIPDTWSESFRYVLRKLAGCWPLHVIMMSVMFVRAGMVFSGRNLLNAALNLSLLHGWIRSDEVVFSFNGVSWFLSALLFCYFLAPFLLRLARKIRPSIIVFFVCAALRIFLEYIHIRCPGEYWTFSFHSFPPVRALEFALGMMMVPMFIAVRKAIIPKQRFWIMSLCEVGMTAGIITICIIYNGEWPRGLFVLAFCPVILVYALDTGMVSKALACRPFRWFSGIQLEFFLIHQALMRCIKPYYKKWFPGWPLRNLLMFVTVIMAAVLYERLLKDRLRRLFTAVLNHILKVLQIDLTV